MRALEVLYHRLTEKMEFMHAARWESLWRSVVGLIKGRRLWLTGIGRSRAGKAQPKHAIKAVDRLLGNEQLFVEKADIYASLASLLLGKHAHPVILVDTVEVGTGFALTAALAFEGRSFPIYSVMTKSSMVEGRTCRTFVRELAAVLPSRVRPIVVTDAGFERPWFTAVEEQGWDFVGRIRGNTSFNLGKGWVRPGDLQKLANNRPRDLGTALFPKRAAVQRRLILSAKPKSSHRFRKSKRGRPRRGFNDSLHKKGANEAWLLTTSLQSGASDVVALYELRMQIEESFRDLKSHRWGWSLRHVRSRSMNRIEILLLIGALAVALQQLVGIAGESRGLHRQHQANTIRSRRVLSFFALGALILRSDADTIPKTALTSALVQIRKTFREISPSGSP